MSNPGISSCNLSAQRQSGSKVRTTRLHRELDPWWPACRGREVGEGKKGREKGERGIFMCLCGFCFAYCCFLFSLHYYLIRNKFFQLFSVCSLHCGLFRDFMDSWEKHVFCFCCTNYSVLSVKYIWLVVCFNTESSLLILILDDLSRDGVGYWNHSTLYHHLWLLFCFMKLGDPLFCHIYLCL